MGLDVASMKAEALLSVGNRCDLRPHALLGSCVSATLKAGSRNRSRFMMAIAQILRRGYPGAVSTSKPRPLEQLKLLAGRAKPRLHKKKPDRKGRDQSGLEGQRERLKR